MTEAVNLLRVEGRMAILDVQLFHGWLRIFNPILVSQTKRFATEHASCKHASKCIEIMKKLLVDVQLDEGYLGMLYIASGVKG